MMRRTSSSSLSPTTRRWPRRVRRTVVGLVLLAGAAAGVTVVRDRTTDEAAPATSVAVLEAATVSTGDLATTESIDGTLTETGSITVVHRIEGQTSSSTGTTMHRAGLTGRPFALRAPGRGLGSGPAPSCAGHLGHPGVLVPGQ